METNCKSRELLNQSMYKLAKYGILIPLPISILPQVAMFSVDLSIKQCKFVLQERILKIDEYTINYAVEGSGDHTVLLLPGAMGK